MFYVAADIDDLGRYDDLMMIYDNLTSLTLIYSNYFLYFYRLTHQHREIPFVVIWIPLRRTTYYYLFSIEYQARHSDIRNASHGVGVKSQNRKCLFIFGSHWGGP